MIYIIDNGCKESGYAVVFVQVQNALMDYRRWIEPLLLWNLREDGFESAQEPKILGMAKERDWRSSTVMLGDFIGWHTFLETFTEVCSHRWQMKTPEPNPDNILYVAVKPNPPRVPDEVAEVLIERAECSLVLQSPAPDEYRWFLHRCYKELLGSGELRP